MKQVFFKVSIIILLTIGMFLKMPAGVGDAVMPDTDSIILARDLISIKLDMLGLPPTDSARYDNAGLDTLLKEEHADILDNNITTTPDGKLKIVVVVEEFCGAYCHNQHASYVHLANGIRLNGANYLGPVQDIYQLPDGKYLVMQSWSEKAFSSCSDNVYAASILSVQGDSVIQHPAIFKNTGVANDTLPLVFRTSFECETPVYLRYNRQTRIITYQHGMPCGYSDVEFELSTGAFTYRHGVFEQTKDSVWRVAHEEVK